MARDREEKKAQEKIKEEIDPKKVLVVPRAVPVEEMFNIINDKLDLVMATLKDKL